MGRFRSRSRSYSPRRVSRSPPRRKHYDDPRDRYRGGRVFRDRRSSAPSGLLIRNLPLDAREPRGFGFVKFRDPEDAAEAKQQMNHKIIGGREIRIVFAEENRKTPQEMRTTVRVSGRYNGGRRGSPPRSPRPRYRSYSRSPSPPVHDSRHRVRGDEDDYYPPQRSTSASPRDDRNYRSHHRSPSPVENGRSPSRSHSYSPR